MLLGRWVPIFVLACGLALGACGPCQVNQAPVANAGADQIICVGESVQLSALASADPDGDTLSYVWTRTLAPAPDDLDSRLIPEPTFIPTASGAYEFSVTVIDGCGGSDSDTIRVVAVAPSKCDRCQSGQCCADADCDDGVPCTLDSCVAGVCQHNETDCPCVTSADCDDGYPCTTDSCSSGVCQHVNNTNPCNDGDSCTSNDHCSNGVCVGTALNCDDGNPCTTDSCSSGVCQHANNTDPCNDGNACTTEDRCSNGVCLGIPECVNDADCDNGLSCDGSEFCSNACCTNGTPPCATCDSCSEGATDAVCEGCGCALETECPPSGHTTDEIWACDGVVAVPQDTTQCFVILFFAPSISSIELVQSPTNGTFDVQSHCYTPYPSYCGTDMLTYRAWTADDRVTRTATVFVDVWCSEPEDECMSYFQCYDRQISPSGDQDPFEFQGKAGQRITAYLENESSCRMLLKLEGPGSTGTPCDTSHSFGCTPTTTTQSCIWGGDSQIDDFEISQDGDYRIVADGCGECTGEYRLCLDRHDAPVVPLSCGETRSYGLPYPGRQHEYVFDGAAGQCISAYLNNLSTCRMLLKLEGPGSTGTPCDTSHSFGCTPTTTTQSCIWGGDSQIDNYRLPAMGTYRIIVDGCGGCAGNYELSFTCASCP